MTVTGRAASARALDRDNPLPLWAQLQRELTRRLARGAFDTEFPGELELVDAYGVSRYTVREALRRLREAGLIDSAKGRGSRVRHGQIEQPLGSLYSMFKAVEARGMRPRSVVLSQGVVRAPQAAGELGLPADEQLFHLERVRLADDVPLAHDRVWLPATAASPLADVDFNTAGLYDELAARCGLILTGGRERISAVLPSPDDRELLAVPDEVACFVIERVGTSRSVPMEYRHTVARADRYSVVAEWTPQGYSVTATADPATAPVADPGSRAVPARPA